MNEIGSLVSQVIPSHSAKSHDFFNAHGGIYSVNVFPYAHISLSDKKFILLNCAHKFLCAFLEFMRILAYSSSFFYAIFQNAHESRWMET